MTEKQRAVIERARRTPAQFVEIRRTDRDCAHDNAMDKFAAEQAKRVSALLEAELQRLAQEWSKE